jgi:hypothetical protein
MEIAEAVRVVGQTHTQLKLGVNEIGAAVAYNFGCIWIPPPGRTQDRRAGRTGSTAGPPSSDFGEASGDALPLPGGSAKMQSKPLALMLITSGKLATSALHRAVFA